MDRKRRTTLIVFLSAIILAGALCAVYFLVLDTVLFITDISWTQVSSRRQTLDLTRELLIREHKRLKVVELDRYGSQDIGTILQRIQAESPSVVLLSPVITAVVNEKGLDISSQFPSVLIMGMGSRGEGLVDCLLVSEESEGWIQASKNTLKEAETSTHNLALIYDSSSKNTAQTIIDAVGEKNVTQYKKTSSSNLFYNETLSDMDRLGLIVALCPYVDDFFEFFQSENSVSWIVDYRMAPAVPEKNLYGCVGPDMGRIADIMGDVEKGSHMKVSLPFEFYR